LEEIKNKIEFHNVDIRNKKILKSFLSDCNGIFHEAALTVVTESFEKPEEYFDVNVNGSKNIFEISCELGIKVVYASSSSVYGNVSEIPIKENFPQHPINPYAQTKVDIENLAQDFWKNNCKIIGLRYFNVFGKGQTGSYAGVITQFLKRLNQNLPLQIYGKGNQIRDFVFVEDVAKANMMAMENKINRGFYNIGTGIGTSILELAKIMTDISKSNLSPIFDKELPGDVEKSQADITLSKQNLMWTNTMSLKDGLLNLL
jgi:UDP-glucose 4-epimerase